ncbi:MAG: NAD(+) diphosphatase [Mycobacteriales bacterium]
MSNPRPLPLSRAAHDAATARRADAAWLASAWRGARVVLLSPEGTAPVTPDGASLAFADAATLPAGAEGWDRYFLGEYDGRPYFALSAPVEATGRWAALRDVGGSLDDLGAGLLTAAVALANWHRTHAHCPRCGTRTRADQGGWSRRCPADASEHFPRTDPAVIMLVHDGGDRCVLGRQSSWPAGRYSVLAGFVDAGEPAERAVVREVGEEVGIAVTDVTYVQSQPWPFPNSLMLGFTARVDGDPTLHVDGNEIEHADWFSRDQIRRRDGVGLPSEVSIAYRLLTDWLQKG